MSNLIMIRTETVYAFNSSIGQIRTGVADSAAKLNLVKNNLDWQVQSRRNIDDRISALQRRTRRQEEKLESYIRILNQIAADFEGKDKLLSENAKNLVYKLNAMSAADYSGSTQDLALAGLKTLDEFKRIQELFGGEWKENGFILQMLRRLINSDFLGKYWSGAGTLFDVLGKVFGDNDKVFATSGGVAKYLNTLYKTFTGDYEDGADITTALLSLFKQSTDMENTIYKFFLNNLDPKDGEALYNRFGGFMGNLSMIGCGTGFIEDAVEVFKAALDPNTSSLSRIADIIKLGGSAENTILTVSNIEQFTKMVFDPEKNKLVNVHADALKEANAYLGVGLSCFNAAETFVRKCEELAADGEFNTLDVWRAFIYSGFEGLSSLPEVKTVSGVVELFTGWSAEDFAEGLIKDCENLGALRADITRDWLTSHPTLSVLVYDENVNGFTKTIATQLSMHWAVQDRVINTVTGWVSDIFK